MILAIVYTQKTSDRDGLKSININPTEWFYSDPRDKKPPGHENKENAELMAVFDEEGDREKRELDFALSNGLDLLSSKNHYNLLETASGYMIRGNRERNCESDSETVIYSIESVARKGKKPIIVIGVVGKNGDIGPKFKVEINSEHSFKGPNTNHRVNGGKVIAIVDDGYKKPDEVYDAVEEANEILSSCDTNRIQDFVGPETAKRGGYGVLALILLAIGIGVIKKKK